MNGLIVVTGATGHIGRGLAEELLKSGAKVRAVARDKAKLESLRAKGAETVSADLTDKAALRGAFAGAEAVFLLNPPNLGSDDLREFQNKVGAAAADAATTADVKFLVHLSSIGGHMSEGAGPVNGLHDVEQLLNTLDSVNVLHLRPSYFMENLLNNIGLIKGMGINGSPLKPDVNIPLIATKDISAVAAKRLLALDFTGKEVQELLGAREYSMADATKILGESIGKPDLKYVQFPYDEALKAMMGFGISKDVAGLFVEMNQGFNEGKITATQGRSGKTTTPTTLEDFARDVFAPAFKA